MIKLSPRGKGYGYENKISYLGGGNSSAVAKEG